MSKTELASTFTNNIADMQYINHNPTGKRVGDCVIRAIAGATGQTWEQVLDGLVRHAKRLYVSPVEKACYHAYLTELGWTRHGQPKLRNGKRVTSKQLATEHDAIMRQAHHVCYSRGGHVIDTWDSENRTVYDYYTKP